MAKEDKDIHAFVDNTGRWPMDALLRKHGWHIARRKKGLPVLWERDGEQATYDEILSQFSAAQIAEARKA